MSLAWNSPCHLLLENPWQQRPPISSRPPSSSIGPVARSAPAPCWSLAPTYFLSRAQFGRPHRRVPINPAHVRGIVRGGRILGHSARTPNLFLELFSGVGRAQRILDSRGQDMHRTKPPRIVNRSFALQLRILFFLVFLCVLRFIARIEMRRLSVGINPSRSPSHTTNRKTEPQLLTLTKLRLISPFTHCGLCPRRNAFTAAPSLPAADPRYATVRLPVQCVGAIEVTTSRKRGAVSLELPRQRWLLSVRRSTGSVKQHRSHADIRISIPLGCSGCKDLLGWWA